MTKEEILAQMKVHQAEYSKLNEEYKALKATEEKENYFKKQQARLDSFRAKYNFFVGQDGAATPIDWEDVSKSINSTTSMEEGYALGWDDTGLPCLVHTTYSAITLTGMVEDESDVRKYIEREVKPKRARSEEEVMYNNEVTYDKKWDTPENVAALKKLDKKFFDKSECSPSCPSGWAPEVLELLERLEREFGIRYNESTLRAYYIQGTPFDHFVTGPFKGMWTAFHSNFIETVDPEKSWQVAQRSKPITARLKRVVDAGLHSIRYGIRAFRVSHINPVLNKIYKPKIRLGQIKEKYGSLVLYFTSPDYLEPYIENLVAQTEIKIALKGCYYPVETMWGNACSHWVGTDYEPDTIETKKDEEGHITVTKTTHRKAMKELGLDLKEMEAKYNEYIAKRAVERSS